MVKLNKIYTKTGDDGTTALGSGERRKKSDLRICAYGTIDELNAAIGMARCEMGEDTMLAQIQNDLFDLGADLCVVGSGATDEKGKSVLRISPTQVSRLEADIDTLNSELEPLRSFVLCGGTRAGAALHLARTTARRAERIMVELSQEEEINIYGLHYINRLSDFLFVAARTANNKGKDDILWIPGENR